MPNIQPSCDTLKKDFIGTFINFLMIFLYYDAPVFLTKVMRSAHNFHHVFSKFSRVRSRPRRPNRVSLDTGNDMLDSYPLTRQFLILRPFLAVQFPITQLFAPLTSLSLFRHAPLKSTVLVHDCSGRKHIGLNITNMLVVY